MTKTKVFLRALFIFILCFTLFISSIYIYIAVNGKYLIENNLEKLFKKEVAINNFKISLPLNITVSNITIKDVGTIEYIYIRPSLISFLSLKIAINNIMVSKPSLSFERKKEEALPLAPLNIETEKPVIEKQKKFNFKLTIPLFIKNLKIADGKISLLDKAAGSVPIKIRIEKVNFTLENFCLPPRQIKTHYNLEGNIPWESLHKVGKIEGDGWIDFYKKDMDGQINFRDIDGKYLAPYYANDLSLEELNIDKASLDFFITLNSHNNDLLVRSRLELKNLLFRKEKELKDNSKNRDASKIMGAVFEVFPLVGGKIVLDFTIKTKFDKPRIGLENIKVTIEDKFSKKVLD